MVARSEMTRANPTCRSPSSSAKHKECAKDFSTVAEGIPFAQYEDAKNSAITARSIFAGSHVIVNVPLTQQFMIPPRTNLMVAACAVQDDSRPTALPY